MDLNSAPEAFMSESALSRSSLARMDTGLKGAHGTPHTIHMDGMWMGKMDKAAGPLAPKGSDSEKITINLGYVDLGYIDLLVQESFYSNRSDFIRTAIRNQLDRHSDASKKSIARHELDLGLRRYGRRDLEAIQAAGETLAIQVLGLVVIEADVSVELARATISSIHVLGALQATPAIKAALADRIS